MMSAYILLSGFLLPVCVSWRGVSLHLLFYNLLFSAYDPPGQHISSVGRVHAQVSLVTPQVFFSGWLHPKPGSSPRPRSASVTVVVAESLRCV